MLPSFEAKGLEEFLPARVDGGEKESSSITEAERALQELAQVFLRQSISPIPNLDFAENAELSANAEGPLINMEAKYRALVEQIPAVVFMAFLDKGIGEAYVSPQNEVERRGGRDVHFWEALAVGVPCDGARRKGALVSVRSENDPARGRASVV